MSSRSSMGLIASFNSEYIIQNPCYRIVADIIGYSDSKSSFLCKLILDIPLSLADLNGTEKNLAYDNY